MSAGDDSAKKAGMDGAAAKGGAPAGATAGGRDGGTDRRADRRAHRGEPVVAHARRGHAVKCAAGPFKTGSDGGPNAYSYCCRL
jgi:hypothetical protein